MSPRPRLLTVTPLLVVADLQRSIDFYRNQVGFGEPSVWGEPPCFAMLERDGFELMLSLQEESVQPTPNGPAEVWDVYLSVTDVAAEIAALAAAGVVLAKGPTDTFYEMREIELVDPDGYRLCFAQDTSQEAAQRAESFAGVLDVGARKLRLVLKLAKGSDGGPRGYIDSLDQGAMNLSVQVTERTSTALRFEMQAIQATYEGQWSADGSTVTGLWTQGGRTWPLAFRRE